VLLINHQQAATIEHQEATSNNAPSGNTFVSDKVCVMLIDPVGMSITQKDKGVTRRCVV
jgi:hypothetical protein